MYTTCKLPRKRQTTAPTKTTAGHQGVVRHLANEMVAIVPLVGGSEWIDHGLAHFLCLVVVALLTVRNNQQ